MKKKELRKLVLKFQNRSVISNATIIELKKDIHALIHEPLSERAKAVTATSFPKVALEKAMWTGSSVLAPRYIIVPDYVPAVKKTGRGGAGWV